MKRIVAIVFAGAAVCAAADAQGAPLPVGAHAFSTIRLPATPENWPAQREMLSHSRDCFDEVWFSACNLKSLAENEARAKWLAEAARDIRAMGYVASLEFEITIGNGDYPDSERLPFKDWTGFTGPDGWEGIRCNCPRDPKFHAYFREQLKHYCAWSQPSSGSTTTCAWKTTAKTRTAATAGAAWTRSPRSKARRGRARPWWRR